MTEYQIIKQTSKSCDHLFSKDDLAAVLAPLPESKGKRLRPTFCLSLPVFNEKEKISRFYALLCESAIKQFYLALAESELSGDAALFSSVAVTHGTDVLLSLYFDLFAEADRSPIFFRRTAQTWLVPEQRMLDIRTVSELLRNKKPSTNDKKEDRPLKRGFRFLKERIPHTDDFYLSDGKIILFRNSFAPVNGRIRRSQYSSVFTETTLLVR